MTAEEAKVAVQATLAVLTRLAEKTRTGADDLLLQILHSNETRLAAAVFDLAKDGSPPTPERVTAALSAVGIRV